MDRKSFGPWDLWRTGRYQWTSLDSTSLPDAETCEDPAEELIGTDAPGDFGQCVLRGAKVFCGQNRFIAVGDSRAGGIDGGERSVERVDVTCARDERALTCVRSAGEDAERCAQLGEPNSLLRR